MKKTKFNPALLKEELNRFKLLNEYAFYNEKQEIPMYDDEKLLLGDLEEADDESAPDDLKPSDDSTEAAANNIGKDLGIDASDSSDATEDGEEETTGDIPEPDAEAPVAPEPAPVAPPEPANDDVEVDVTSLVKGSEEAKRSADMASRNSQMLMQKLNDLEARVANMDKINAKIDGLEQEIIKRNPTPVEKLEMRSLSSYPYSQKLTDYWKDKEGPYNVMGEPEKKEYTLTKDDVDSGYSESNIKKSFNVNPDEYEEEDIY